MVIHVCIYLCKLAYWFICIQLLELVGQLDVVGLKLFDASSKVGHLSRMSRLYMLHLYSTKCIWSVLKHGAWQFQPKVAQIRVHNNLQNRNLNLIQTLTLRQCDNYNRSSHKRCNNMSRINLSGYVLFSSRVRVRVRDRFSVWLCTSIYTTYDCHCQTA